jgi:fatty-acyl-CoA synthase
MLHGDVLGERARLTPEKTALVEVASGRRFTYAELDARACRAARVLGERYALAPGDRYAVLAANGVEFLDLFFAAGKSGAIVVPLSTRATARELEMVVRDAGARVLCYSAEHATTAATLAGAVASLRCIALDGGGNTGDGVWEDELGSLPDAAWRRQAVPPESVYTLLYTSGTTGQPKGVMVPHRMLAWNAWNTVVNWQLREDDVSPIFTPLYHAGGLGAFLLPLFAIGARVVLHRGFDATEVWRTIESEGATVVLGVPTIWKMLLEAAEFASVDLRHVRWLISGGAPLPLYIIEAFGVRGVAFKQGYGLTEVGVNCFTMTVAESVRKAGSIGKPLAFTEAKLVDDAGAEVVDSGVVGELLLRGPHVSLGYWQQPAATAAALDDDGWFHTGDLARRDAEGFFTIAGRRKEMLISGGVNVYPAEIEGELLLHPAVEDAAVVGVADPTWGEVGVAFVVARGEEPAASDLLAFLGERLARYKLPKRFLFLPALPRTAYGKVVRSELRELLANEGP